MWRILRRRFVLVMHELNLVLPWSTTHRADCKPCVTAVPTCGHDCARSPVYWAMIVVPACTFCPCRTRISSPVLARKRQFGARTKFDHPELTATWQVFARPYPADDPPRNGTGNLPHAQSPHGRRSFPAAIPAIRSPGPPPARSALRNLPRRYVNPITRHSIGTRFKCTLKTDRKMSITTAGPPR